MSVFITGATGFIGNHVLARLLDDGEAIQVLSRRLPTELSLCGRNLVDPSRIKMFQGDILDAGSLPRAMKGCDRVYHIAAYALNWARDPRMFSAVNVAGVLNVLNAARDLGIRRVVVTSSEVTLGPSNGTPVEASVMRTASALTAYEQSKIDAERAIHEFLEHHNAMDVMVVNPTRVFGPGLLNEGNSATRMIDFYLRGTWRLILAKGEAIGNYAYVKDVAAGHLLAMKHGRCGERYVLGGENLSFNSFFEMVATLSGRKRRMFHIPAPAALAFSAFEEFRARVMHHHPLITPGWVRTFLCDWACSCEKSRQEIHYAITPFAEALRETIEWLSHKENES